MVADVSLTGWLHAGIMSTLGTALPHLRKLVLRDSLLSTVKTASLSLNALPPSLTILDLSRAVGVEEAADAAAGHD